MSDTSRAAAPALSRPVPTHLALLALAAVVLSWGLTWPANKVILERVTPLWLAAIRSVIAAATLLGIAAVRGDLRLPRRGDLPVVVSVGLLHMTGFTVLASIGLHIVTTGRTVVLAYTTPLWIVPGARIFLGEPAGARRLAGVAIGLLGLAILFNPMAFDWHDARALRGNAAILTATFLWSASILHVRGHRWQSSAFELVPWQMSLAAIVLVCLAVPFSTPPLGDVWDARRAGLMLFVALPGTALAYWAVSIASRNLPAVTTSLGLLATPVVGIVVATITLGEPITATLIAAVVLILGGIALGVTGRRA